jgi:hypothetical protein
MCIAATCDTECSLLAFIENHFESITYLIDRLEQILLGYRNNCRDSTHAEIKISIPEKLVNILNKMLQNIIRQNL